MRCMPIRRWCTTLLFLARSSTAFTRESSISGMPTHLVPLTNLLHEQASYWAPWQTGVRGDSVLCRALRSQQHLVDLLQLFQHYSDKMPEAGRKDIYNWEYRMQLSRHTHQQMT